MSVVLVLTPVVIGGWPVITAAVAGAAAAMGLAVSRSAKDYVEDSVEDQVAVNENQVEVELADSEVLAESMVENEEIVLTKGNVELRVRRDETGRCTVCAEGPGHTKAELKTLAEEFGQRMAQCFVYNRVMSEVKARGFNVVNEEQMQDDSVRIHLRRYEEG